ncbi:MAG TPA: hypothetical protein VJB14_07855 [Planctomycetota bacterium]|nr:hypothetical protein [Planctomycetota bacterium]
MKRLERFPRIIFVERNLIDSLSLVCAFCACVLPLWRIHQDSGDEWGSLLWLVVELALLLVGSAFVLLFTVRVFAVDSSLNQFLMLERGLLMRTRKTVLPVEKINLWIVTRFENPDSPAVVDRRAYYLVLIHPVGEPAVTFASGRDLESVRARAEELARDLGRPLWADATASRAQREGA